MNKIRAPRIGTPYGYKDPRGLGPRHNTREAQGPAVSGNGNDRMVISPDQPRKIPGGSFSQVQRTSGRSHAGYRKLPNI